MQAFLIEGRWKAGFGILSDVVDDHVEQRVVAVVGFGYLRRVVGYDPTVVMTGSSGSKCQETRVPTILRSRTTILRQAAKTLRLRLRRFGPVEWEFAICAVFRNEARYLAEWLEFHELMGVEHFFLYDDQSTDDVEGVLKPWMERGRVTLRPSKGKGQNEVYEHCLWHGARRCRWVAFIDIDEFLFSPLALELPDVMKRYADCPAVFVHWLLFGSSGHQAPPPGGTLKNFVRTIGLEKSIEDDFDHRPSNDKRQLVFARSRQGKTIVNPRAVVEAGVHRPRKLLWGEIADEKREKYREQSPPGTVFSCDVLRINHYWSRSIEELGQKIERGYFGDPAGMTRNLERQLEREAILNEVEDREILHVVDSMSRAKPSRG